MFLTEKEKNCIVKNAIQLQQYYGLQAFNHLSGLVFAGKVFVFYPDRPEVHIQVDFRLRSSVAQK